MLFQAVASGITAGSVYALVALAFVLVYKGTRVVNAGLPFGAALALALVLAGVSC